jgi:hypothetical protein
MTVSEERERQVRNEIFGGQGHQPGMPTRNVMKDDFGFEVPVESVPLPSRGIVYPAESALHGKETIDIRAMTAREEDILTSRALIKKGTVISELIQSCLVDKNIDVNEMISGDRNAVMTALRITGYGPEYKVEVDCPACGERSKQEFSLAELPIKRLEISPITEGANIFEFQLPAVKKNIRFRFLTGKDEEEITQLMERKKKSGLQGENLVTTRLSHCLMAVEEITDKTKVGMFIRNMPARDSLALRQFMDKHEPGVDMRGWMTCPHCIENSEVRLPLGASFFWPDAE